MLPPSTRTRICRIRATSEATHFFIHATKTKYWDLGRRAMAGG
jgi:hypothetical protein